MFLATTALTDFWDKDQELLFLGLWCLPREKIKQWEGARGKVMPSPWDEAGRSDLLTRQCGEDLPERLLDFLGATLNEELGVSRTPKYWRVLLRPWALAHVAVVADHWLHLDAAFRHYAQLATIGLDPQDFAVPRDTGDHTRLLLKDSYHLQLYSELLKAMGREIPTRRLPAGAEAGARAAQGLNAAKNEILLGLARGLRSFQFSKTYFGGFDLTGKESWSLIKLSRGKVWPVGEEMPAEFRAAAEPGRRERLARFPAHGDLERLVAKTLPTHFPTLFLEGYHRWRELVLSRWPRAPQRLIAGRGLIYDEYLKMLAAEGLERNGRVAVFQGDSDGLQEATLGEKHERSIADQYWTWGWTEEKVPGAKIKAMPDPRRCRPAPPKGRATNQVTAFIGTSLPRYPYVTGFDRMPLWHRFYDYLKERNRFIAALPAWIRDAMTFELDAPDLGWGHKERLKARFPTVRAAEKPWQQRLDSIKLLIIDHPLVSPVQALSLNVPTLLFWDPALWKPRPVAKPAFDALRVGGILHDDPESAARQTAWVLKDPKTWWRSENPQQARAEFCRRYAAADPDWAKAWIKAAQEI